jgi:hypothetical protein
MRTVQKRFTTTGKDLLARKGGVHPRTSKTCAMRLAPPRSLDLRLSKASVFRRAMGLNRWFVTASSCGDQLRNAFHRRESLRGWMLTIHATLRRPASPFSTMRDSLSRCPSGHPRTRRCYVRRQIARSERGQLLWLFADCYFTLLLLLLIIADAGGCDSHWLGSREADTARRERETPAIPGCYRPAPHPSPLSLRRRR